MLRNTCGASPTVKGMEIPVIKSDKQEIADIGHTVQHPLLWKDWG